MSQDPNTPTFPPPSDNFPPPPPAFTPPPPVTPPPYESLPQMPQTPGPKKSNRTLWIILIVAVVLLCCCCLAAAGYYLYVNGDQIFNTIQNNGSIIAPFFSIL